MKKSLGYIVGAIVIVAFGVYFWLTGQNGQNGLATVDNSGGNSSPAQTPSGISAGSTGQYKDGTYTGPVTDAIYGQLQVVATIKNGKLVSTNCPIFPDAPGHTTLVSNMSLPQLKQEAIAAQSANVNIVSGATQTSEAFQQSLAAALSQAKS